MFVLFAGELRLTLLNHALGDLITASDCKLIRKHIDHFLEQRRLHPGSLSIEKLQVNKRPLPLLINPSLNI